MLAGIQGDTGFESTGTTAAVNAAVATAGGTIANDLSAQIGVLVVESTSASFVSRNGDVELAPSTVESIMERSAIDIGQPGYDTCFGNGRIDALRAVERDFSGAYDATAPFCPEYTD